MSDKQWVTVTQASELMGVTVGWVRLLLKTNKLAGWKVGPRAWLLQRTDCLAHREKLGTLSTFRRKAIACRKTRTK